MPVAQCRHVPDRALIVDYLPGPRSQVLPGVDQSNATSVKAANVTGGDAGARRACCRGDQSVERFDGIARLPPCSDDRCIMCHCDRPERQDAACKIIIEHGRGRFCEQLSAPAIGQDFNPMEDLSLIDARGEQCCPWLLANPCEYPRMRHRTHKFRDDVGVQDDHSSKRGGCPIATGGWRSSSTPPNGAKRRRMASPRLGSPGVSW